MIWVLRLVVLLVELAGLFFAIRLVHDGEFGVAFLRLLFETAILIMFVLTHCLIEWILSRNTLKNRNRWWV